MKRSLEGRRQRGGAGTIVLVLLLVVVVAVIAFLTIARLQRRDVTLAGAHGGRTRTTSTSRGGGTAGNGTVEPGAPGSFHGCPPDGDGGDRSLNRLKNRVAPAALSDMWFDSLLALPIPEDADGSYRSRWPKRVVATVAAVERRAVRVEAFVARATLSGPESTNCHGDDAGDRDFHIWLTAAPTSDRTRSVIVEMTPRSRALHSGWDLPHLRAVSKRRDRVRVGGWLLLDQEHPDQIGRTRGTIWEIHPVTTFEVLRGGRWIPLDDVPLPRGRR